MEIILRMKLKGIALVRDGWKINYMEHLMIEEESTIKEVLK